jgi:hypothetical protein
MTEEQKRIMSIWFDNVDEEMDEQEGYRVVSKLAGVSRLDVIEALRAYSRAARAFHRGEKE